MNVTQRFFQAKPMKIIKIFFSVLNGINSMSGRKVCKDELGFIPLLIYLSIKEITALHYTFPI